MTKGDREEMQAMFDVGISHIKEIMRLKFDAIIEQTTKINDTVTRHADRLQLLERNLPHTISDCPQNVRIQKMWEDRITRKSLISIIAASITIAGILAGIMFSVLSYVNT